MTPIQLDLASFDSVKAAAKTISGLCDGIDVLFLNAGVSTLAPGLTKDGYEIQFGTNYMGHVLLTQLLLPKLQDAMNRSAVQPQPHIARVVVVASDSATQFTLPGDIVFDALKTDMAAYSALQRYGQSKLAEVLFAQALSKQVLSLTTVSSHPGFTDTPMITKLTGMRWIIPALRIAAKLFAHSPDEGAKTQLWCAFAMDIRSGAFYYPNGEVDTGKFQALHNSQLRNRLWEWTNQELADHGGPGWSISS